MSVIMGTEDVNLVLVGYAVKLQHKSKLIRNQEMKCN